eukprot:m.23168 g.23168  ORF g.23168 m.23168 type:complete len:130 (+) comp7469_c1_seq1:1417-1806(+)
MTSSNKKEGSRGTRWMHLCTTLTLRLYSVWQNHFVQVCFTRIMLRLRNDCKLDGVPSIGFSKKWKHNNNRVNQTKSLCFSGRYNDIFTSDCLTQEVMLTLQFGIELRLSRQGQEMLHSILKVVHCYVLH